MINFIKYLIYKIYYILYLKNSYGYGKYSKSIYTKLLKNIKK